MTTILNGPVDLTFEDGLTDAPDFRQKLAHTETSVSDLGTRMEKVIKACDDMRALGRQFKQFDGDDLLPDLAERFCDVQEELEANRKVLLDQAVVIIQDSLNKLLKAHIKPVKNSGKVFAKLSDDLDSSRFRHAGAPKSKKVECREAHNHLTAMQACFNHTTLDYIFQLKLLKQQLHVEVSEKLLAYLQSTFSHYHQGYDHLKDADVYMRSTSTKLNEVHEDNKRGKRIMEQNLAEAQMNPQECLNKTPVNSNLTSGYLFKRSHNTFKTWNLRWFVLENGRLAYCTRSPKGQVELTPMVADVRICTVKKLLSEPLDRQHVFELVTPTKSYMLQAESAALMQAWVSSITNATEAALQQQLREPDRTKSTESSTTESSNSGKLLQDEIRDVAGNAACADCRQSNPQWASINLGAVLCIECSGIHRSLGVHVSKVRSLSLDKIDTEVCEVMLALGNDCCARILEENCDSSSLERPTASSLREEKEAWIAAKYIKGEFLADPPPGDINEHLLEAASRGDMIEIRRCVAHKANLKHQSASGDTALMLAAQHGHRVAAALILLNDSDVGAQNEAGKTALHLACQNGHTHTVFLLIKYHADLDAVDNEGKTPLDTALENTHADIVTLIRLAVMKAQEGNEDEMNEDWIDTRMKDFEGPVSRSPSAELT